MNFSGNDPSARIRWQDAPIGGGDVYVIASKGYVGTIEEPAFRIYTPDAVHDNWLLSVRLTGGSKFIYASDPDKLKAEAERWLEEFTASLGAVFPGEPVEPREALRSLRCVQAGWAFGVPEDGREQWLDLVAAAVVASRLTAPSAPGGAGEKE